MAMNENENKTAVPAGTPKNSGRYPWIQDEGLTEIEAMGAALLELEDELNSVVEDLHRWFGRHGIEELGTIRSDLDHINEVLRPRIECQHSSIYAQYNKKLKQLDELAKAYAEMIEKNATLEDKADELEFDLRAKSSVNVALQNLAESRRKELEELSKKADMFRQERDEMRDSFESARQSYLQESEENERLTAKVKEAEEKNIKLVTKNYDLETRVRQLESESGDSYDCDEGYSEGYHEGYNESMKAMYDALLTMMGIINADDFEEVFHISETATDEEIIEHFRQMHPRVFMEACKRYEEHVMDKIKVGDEVQYVSGWRMIVTEVKDKWYKGIIRLSQSPTNIRKDQCRKTGNHYSSIPFSYDGRMAIDDENDEDEEF